MFSFQTQQDHLGMDQKTSQETIVGIEHKIKIKNLRLFVILRSSFYFVFILNSIQQEKKVGVIRLPLSDLRKFIQKKILFFFYTIISFISFCFVLFGFRGAIFEPTHN